MISPFEVKGYQVLLAFLLDLVIGDPRIIPHPVCGIGKIIAKYEALFRKLPVSEKIQGVFFFLGVVFTLFILGLIFCAFLSLLERVSFFLSQAIFIFVSSLFLALKSLIDAGLMVEEALKKGDILLARMELKALVGRDTENLDKKEIRKAILESYAENLNDAVIAPLFWFALLGFMGLLIYKTVNTLDSMVGYKNERYLHFGWFSAKMDDLLNFIPARITAILISLSALFYLGKDAFFRTLSSIKEFAHLHPSPNSGYPEAALAGALGVRLLGPSFYEKKLIPKPYLGYSLHENYENALFMAIRLLYFSSFIMIGLILFLKGF